MFFAAVAGAWHDLRCQTPEVLDGLRCRNPEVIQTVRTISATRRDRLRRPPRRACSAEAFLPAFLEKQQGFHVSAKAALTPWDQIRLGRGTSTVTPGASTIWRGISRQSKSETKLSSSHRLRSSKPRRRRNCRFSS